MLHTVNSCYKMKDGNDTSSYGKIENLKGTVQKSALSKEDLESVCNLLLSKVSLTIRPRTPVLRL